MRLFISLNYNNAQGCKTYLLFYQTMLILQSMKYLPPKKRLTRISLEMKMEMGRGGQLHNKFILDSVSLNKTSCFLIHTMKSMLPMSIRSGFHQSHSRGCYSICMSSDHMVQIKYHPNNIKRNLRKRHKKISIKIFL